MKPQIACSLLSLIPALGLWLSYPRRQWAAAGALALSLIAAAMAPSVATRLCAGWAVLGAAYGVMLCRRSIFERKEQLRALEETRQRRETLARQVAEVKAAGLRTEREHKETLAL
jgi:hypothetical protein